MSLYSAMYAGVSALQSQSSAMAAIGDNIANVSTIGYKDTQVSFSTLVTKQTNTTSYSSGGVFSKASQNVSTQGSLTATTISTDVALSGNGFFVVNTNSTPANGLMCYTRSGSFSTDQNGYLVNDGGYYMMGWPLQKATGNEPASSLLTVNDELFTRAYTKADGSAYYVNTNVVDSTELQPLNLNTLGGTADATLNITLGANLPADNAVGTEVATTASVYDALGITHNIDWTWTKAAANSWDISMTPPSGAATVTGLNANSVNAGAGTNAYFAAGQLQFSGAWESTTMPASLDGITFTVNNGTTSATYELDTTGAAVSGGTAISIVGAASWNDVCTAIATQLNTDDAAPGQFGANAAGAGGPNSNGTRFASDGSGSVIMTQSGDGLPITVSGFTDNTTGGVMLTYLTTAGVTGGTFTIPTLDASGNYWGATSHLPAAVPDISAMTFNGNGTPATINITDMDVRWANGANDMTGNKVVSLNFGTVGLSDGITQLSAPYQVNFLSQDGAKFGNFSGVDVSADGVVTAMFDNGVRTPIFQIPVATFVNPNGMESLSGNAWIQTDASGSYTMHIAGTAGAGEINSAALESSTVDLSSEFTTMIVTQRAYSAASKVITTANSMMDDLLQIIR